MEIIINKKIQNYYNCKKFIFKDLKVQVNLLKKKEKLLIKNRQYKKQKIKNFKELNLINN